MLPPSLGACLCSLALLNASVDEVQHATIPGQKVEVALTLPGFKAEAPDDPAGTLLFGRLGDGVAVSLLYEDNFPYLPGAERVRRRTKEPKFKSFQAGEVACCEYTADMRGLASIKHFFAFPTTEDYSFALHVSVTTPAKGPSPKFERAAFVALLPSFAAQGRADVSGFVLPSEVYAVRDEAADSGIDGLTWTKKRILERPDDWPTNYYLGALGYEKRDDDLTVKGFGHAAELLAALGERPPKATFALAKACDMAAVTSAGRKKFAEAAPWCELLLSATPVDAPADIQKFRHEALFNLACCYAMTRRLDEAMDKLRMALEGAPALRQRLNSELLDPLRTRADFKKLSP
ncbi:MAG: hypothetical protein EXS08_06985 [Planctomycetes bacterium]|nr:hypothetical protein [Planctomycetota bacterium]